MYGNKATKCNSATEYNIYTKITLDVVYCTFTWVYQKVPRLSSTDRKQTALGEYLRYD